MSMDSIITMVTVFVLLMFGPGFIGRSAARAVVAYRAEIEKAKTDD